MKDRLKTKPFRGWYNVGMAFAANFVSVGTGFYIFNAFMQPLCDQRGWTRTEVSRALLIGTFVGASGQIIYGTLVNRVGPRALMVFGSILASASFILLGRVHGLYAFYMFYVLLFFGNGAYGGIVANTAVNNWFVKKRGSAMGLATAGVSLSGAVVPMAAMLMLRVMDLGSAFAWIGAAILLIGPAAWLTVRNRPEDFGLLPDGLTPESFSGEEPRCEKEAEVRPGVQWTLRRIVRTQAFWKMGPAYAMVMMGVVGVMSQLKPRFSDLGYGDMAAMTMMGATALMGAVGKYFWGMLCDRFDSRRVAAVLMAGGGIGLGLNLVPDSRLALIMFILCFGFAMGGVMSTFPVMVADMFGRESFASVLRFVGVFLVLELAGYEIAGRSFDLTGSYNAAYQIFIVLDLAAAALILSLKRPKPAEEPDHSG